MATPTSKPSGTGRSITLSRCLLALLSGLCSWWAVNWWLEPRPAWQFLMSDQSSYSPLSEDSTGKWLAAEEVTLGQEIQEDHV